MSLETQRGDRIKKGSESETRLYFILLFQLTAEGISHHSMKLRKGVRGGIVVDMSMTGVQARASGRHFVDNLNSALDAGC